MSALLLLACVSAPVDTGLAGVGEDPELLAGPALARRLSLDLRGVPPTLDELARVEADPEAAWTLRDEWLDDHRLEQRLVYLLAERWWTRVDSFNVEEDDLGLDLTQTVALAHSVGEEPLRLAARVVVEDRPWSEVVTADWTMADPALEALYPLDREPGEGWQVARYTDGRPAAGVLATNGLWWRYTAAFANLNRARVAALADLFLCEDLLSRPVSFTSVVGAIDAEVQELIRTDPSCQSCHSSIEPVAATLFGFWWAVRFNISEMVSYHPEREALGPSMLGVEPAWFGTPVAGLADVGLLLADDPRYARCAAERAAELLWRRAPELDDFDTVSALMDVYTDSGASLKAVLAAVTETAQYRAPAPRLLSPDQLAATHAELAGATWSVDALDLLGNDALGYRVLAGGVDGELVLSPQRDPGLTWALVVARQAQHTAALAVQDELVAGSARHLFAAVTLDDRPGDAVFSAELDQLCRRAWGRSPTQEEQAELEALWTEAEALAGADLAWEVVVGAILRDPEAVTR